MAGYRIVPYRPFMALGVVLAMYSTIPAVAWVAVGSPLALVILLAMVRAAIWCFEHKARA